MIVSKLSLLTFSYSFGNCLFLNDCCPADTCVKGRCRDWQWLATTLNPYYEGNNLQAMIDDDRFIDGTRNHWYFGADDTGDIMNTDNLDGLLKACAERGMKEFHLVSVHFWC